MIKRRGTTLVEVLIAIFVMGIGLIAIMALFPLGAMRMAQAIQDDRCLALARQAEAVAGIMDIRNDAALSVFPNPFNDPPTPPAVPLGAPLFLNAPVHPDGPSYPVLIDPIGFRSVSIIPSQIPRNLVGGTTIPDNRALANLRRRSVSFVEMQPATPGAAKSQAALRWFSLLDDIYFTPDATPRFVTGTTLERDNRYSFAYLVQRPRAGNTAVANLSIVVFNKRPISMAATGIALNEIAYDAFFDVNRNIVTIAVTTQTAPNIRSGDWILDSTAVISPPIDGVVYRTAHGAFYRVVGVTALKGNLFELEVQRPLRDFLGSTIPEVAAPVNPPASATITTGSSIYRGAAIFMEGVAEVFEKGTVR